MKKIHFTAIAFAATVFTVLGGISLAQQDKYTLKVPGGLAFSEFRGYEEWPVVATSGSPNLKLVAVILANPEMIEAYKAGIPENGKPFPDGAKMAKIHWKPAKQQYFPDTTVPGTYNGGLENYPRFHESWSGTTLFYRGSFVSLGTPRHSNGNWCGTGAGCNIYNAPQRNWDYDTDFQNVANLPPLTPRFVAVDQILFTENFR